jgi:uncharacterized protein YkwD
MRSVAAVSLAFFSLLALPSLSAASGGGHDGGERAIVREVNQQRAQHGLAPLRGDGRLGAAAEYHSWEMLAANYFAHTSRNGGSFESRVRRFARYPTVGETLAWVSRCGRGSARQVVSLWMNSSGHRAILLSSQFRRIGVGQRAGRLGSASACVVTADFGAGR